MQISPVYQKAIWHLGWKQGWPVRMLARLFRLDRSTVARIVARKRIPWVPTVQVVRRCPECGALSVPPCLACQLRKRQ